MQYPLQITFRNMPSSPAIENQIREKAAKLKVFYDRILNCHVTVEAPHRHHHKGKAYPVRIALSVPGPDIVVNHAPKRLDATPNREEEPELSENHRPSKHGAHEDLYVALRDAFNAAGRKLQDRARRKTKAIKTPRSMSSVKTPDGEEGS